MADEYILKQNKPDHILCGYILCNKPKKVNDSV